jgi:hypothetical protein
VVRTLLTQDTLRNTGSCDHGNKPSGSIKGGVFDYLSDFTLYRSTKLLVR